MTRVYICHEFGNKEENRQLIVDNLRKLLQFNENVLYISPVLLYGDFYTDISYDKSVEYCMEILKDCDMMITFGNKSLSKGCLIEKDFCIKNNIKIIDMNEFIGGK